MSILDTTGNEIRIVPLGAGQDVGRSCIIATIGGKNVMLDCGMHMGFQDERRFPDFTYITDKCPLDDFIDCVLISHFHLDHCGALPYMSEMVKYKGPIIMTPPTKAITPILLEDYRKVQVQYKGDTNFFTSEMIRESMGKVVSISLHETIQVDAELEVKCYYAGHVLGAAMFLIRANGHSLLYTGDYNMTPDRHLGAAKIDCCFPDVLITESTYATTIRDSKRCRERDFLLKVHECVKRGGKVLIPVFALGRAQELCILLDTYWERMQIKVPIYFTLGLTERATNYYKLFITWTNEKVRETFVDFNMFDFKHISAFQHSVLDNAADKPMVVFATPGMLHGGTSLAVFKRWASDPKNMIIMPGYCTQGTVGARILNGEKTIEFEHKQVVEVKLEVEYMSFSAHADAKGIMQMVQNCQPKHVVLVHGEAEKMKFLSEKIETEMSIPCYYPANGQCLTVESDRRMPALVANSFLSTLRAKYEHYFFMQIAKEMRRSAAVSDGSKSAPNIKDAGDAGSPTHRNIPVDFYPVEGVFIMARSSSDGRQRLYIFDRDTAGVRLNALSAALSSNTAALTSATDSGRSPAASTAFSDDDDIIRKILANPTYNQPNATKRHKFSMRSTLALPNLPHLLCDELFERVQYAVSDAVPFADVKVGDTKTMMTVRSIEAKVVATTSSDSVLPASSAAAAGDAATRSNKQNIGCTVDFEWLCEDEDIIDDVVDAIEQAAAQCLL